MQADGVAVAVKPAQAAGHAPFVSDAGGEITPVLSACGA
jgi:hypothetical protein